MHRHNVPRQTLVTCCTGPDPLPTKQSETDHAAVRTVREEPAMSAHRTARRRAAAAAALLLGGLLVLPSTGAAAATTGASGPSGAKRTTTLGPVVGERTAGTYAWRGIPYAEPPTGDLRWHPPVTHRPWKAARTTTRFGNGCPQPGRFFSPSPNGPQYDLDVRDGLGRPVGDEDCLTLNVFRPDTTQQHLPVIVFVHGGSNTVGYSADPMYDGRTLAKRAGAVVVTVNYRLGLFGWFDAASVKTGDPVGDSGNFGTLDQVEALRFVNANAKAFGGDPDNVTVMGESAGSVNTWALLVSPLTTGLIDKAIPMSGGFQFTTQAASKVWAEGFADKAVREAQPGEDTSDVAAYLRSKPASYLVDLLLRNPQMNQNPPAVIPDGTVLPLDPHVAVATGQYRKVPVLAGNMLEEGKLFGSLISAYRPTDRDRFTMQYTYDPDAPALLRVEDLIADTYLPVDRPGGWDDASAALGDGVFTPLTVDSMNTLQAAGGEQLFYYQFAWDEEPAPFCQVYGAVHAMDLPFAFGNFGRSVYSFAFSQHNRPGRLDLSGLMTSSIRQFVRTGSPQTERLGRTWEQWPHAMVLDASADRASTRLLDAPATQVGQDITGC